MWLRLLWNLASFCVFILIFTTVQRITFLVTNAMGSDIIHYAVLWDFGNSLVRTGN
jgi:hypothetical protein